VPLKRFPTPPSGEAQIITTCHARLETALPFCGIPSGTTPAKRAAAAGLSNAAGVPDPATARKIPGGSATPAKPPCAGRAAVQLLDSAQTCRPTATAAICQENSEEFRDQK